MMILETNLRTDNYSPLHVPEVQIIPVPLQAALMPHLQTPSSHLSEASPEHGGFTPQLHLFEAQVSDNPVHS